MKASEWLKELRAWLGTAALLVLAVLSVLYLPDYLKRAEAERKEREALIKYVQETTPEEHVARVKKLAQEKAAQERAAREAEGK
jgi:hypothetical protein